MLNLRRGQSVPEDAAIETVTVYAISGHITFFEAGSPFQLRSGEVLFIEGGILHSLEAHEDATLLVVAAGPRGALHKNSAVIAKSQEDPQPC